MTRARLSKLLAVAPFVVAISACGSSASDGSTMVVAAGPASGTLRLEGRDVVIAPAGRPVARVDSRGGFTIGGRPVAATPLQREELASYNRAAYAMVDSSVAVGTAGVAMAGSVIGTVFRHLLTGNSQDLQSKTDAETRVLRRKVVALCRQLTEMDQYQNAVAATMPAFRPYAVLKSDAVNHCQGEATHGAANSQQIER